MKSRQKYLLAVSASAVVVIATYAAQMASADSIPAEEPLVYTGVLEENGQLVEGERNIDVSVWTAADDSPGSPVCTTYVEDAPITDGRFRVPLDDACTDAATVHSDLWAEVRVDGSSLGRAKLGAVPYAVSAKNGVPVGTVVPFAGPKSSIPNGWLLCDGAELERDAYPRLFQAIGTSHGGGDGASTFVLPDYRGRFLRGTDHAAGRDPGAAARVPASDGGNSGDKVGSVQDHAIGSHVHQAGTLSTSTDGEHTHSSRKGKTSWGFDRDGADRHANSKNISDRTSADGQHSHTVEGQVAEAGGPETRPKNSAVNYIIKY